MAKKKIEAVCPSCEAEYSIEVDLPTPEVIAAPAVDPEKIKEEVRAKVMATIDAEKANKVHEELEEWRSGVKHHDFDPENVLGCPNCGPKMRRYVSNQVNDAVNKLSRDRVRELARNYGDWPHPTIEIPDELLRYK